MLVYRICSKHEIEQILNYNEFTAIGNYGLTYLNDYKNSHKYKLNKLYLHFFKNKDSIFYMDTSKDRFICTYDIPEDILKTGMGIGKYLDYFNFSHLLNVCEYAIESSLINFEYLLKIERINKYIDIEDYMYDKELSEFVDAIYDKKTKTLKK